MIKLKSVPKLGDKSDDVKQLQRALMLKGFDPGPIDGDFGVKTKFALAGFQKAQGMIGTGIIPKSGGKTFKALGLELEKPAHGDAPPWYLWAKTHDGKREQDKKFNAYLSGFWKYVGLPGFTSISGKKRAWCGLFVAAALVSTGFVYMKTGAGAKNWAKYGVEIDWEKDGIPRGAIIHINSNCKSSSGNHVTLADGDCTVADLNKSGLVPGRGGNQGDASKRSMYSVRSVCAVRWPPDYPKPGPVLKSVNCSGKSGGSESTR